jgi:hypothetical protein
MNSQLFVSISIILTSFNSRRFAILSASESDITARLLSVPINVTTGPVSFFNFREEVAPDFFTAESDAF